MLLNFDLYGNYAWAKIKIKNTPYGVPGFLKSFCSLMIKVKGCPLPLVSIPDCDVHWQDLKAQHVLVRNLRTVNLLFANVGFWWLHQSVTFSVHWGGLQPNVKELGLEPASSRLRLWLSVGKRWIAAVGWGGKLLPQVRECKYLRVLWWESGANPSSRYEFSQWVGWAQPERDVQWGVWTFRGSSEMSHCSFALRGPTCKKRSGKETAENHQLSNWNEGSWTSFRL